MIRSEEIYNKAKSVVKDCGSRDTLQIAHMCLILTFSEMSDRRDKDIMVITYILNTEDYTNEPYSDGGFSGKLLLAKPKTTGLPKLLIKSENPSSACNEFMYSRLAELLRVPALRAYMMEVSKKDRRLFSSPYKEDHRLFQTHRQRSINANCKCKLDTRTVEI